MSFLFDVRIVKKFYGFITIVTYSIVRYSKTYDLMKLRTKEERLLVILNLRDKLRDYFQLDVNDPDCDALKKLKAIFSQYVNQDDAIPKKMVSFSGKIPFHEIERVIHYSLPVKKINEPYIILKNN
jgi:hypothetical protein